MLFPVFVGYQMHPTIFVVHNTEATKLGLWVSPPTIHSTRRTHHCLLDGYITCLREGCNERTVQLDSSRHANFPDDVISPFLTLEQEPDSVPVLCKKIKTFLASQGMIKGHSGPSPAILTSNCKFSCSRPR